MNQRFRSQDHFNSRQGPGIGNMSMSSSSINSSGEHHPGSGNLSRHGSVSSINDDRPDTTNNQAQHETTTFVRRDVTPPPEKAVNVVPPSPPAAPPSGLALAQARLSHLTAQMEFQYAKHLQLSTEHDIIKAKISTLKDLPVGMDAFREDLEKLMK